MSEKKTDRTVGAGTNREGNERTHPIRHRPIYRTRILAALKAGDRLASVIHSLKRDGHPIASRIIPVVQAGQKKRVSECWLEPAHGSQEQG